MRDRRSKSALLFSVAVVAMCVTALVAAGCGGGVEVQPATSSGTQEGQGEPESPTVTLTPEQEEELQASIAALQDEDPVVRARASEALEELGDARAIDPPHCRPTGR